MASPQPIGWFRSQPIYRNGEIVGRTTLGVFGHSVGTSVSMDYIDTPDGDWKEWFAGGRFEIEVAGVNHRAICSGRPSHGSGQCTDQSVNPVPSSAVNAAPIRGRSNDKAASQEMASLVEQNEDEGRRSKMKLHAVSSPSRSRSSKQAN
ncbi:glycine cleavage T C-terminal barrel domain-containing protein [Agrobacterium tomkonis]|uniref:glycine cleavage T C-terminal barrel domain-containing protein n=1 Tax=Agrobacterium tomkonis TaxID=1183410 RepID=UPI001CDA1C82